MVWKHVIFRSISRSVSLISALAAGCGGAPEARPPQPPPVLPAPPNPAAAPAPAEVADVAIVGGDVWTMDPAPPRVTAVAWRGDHVVAVGDDATVRALVGPTTCVIELHGRAATPGLID